MVLVVVLVWFTFTFWSTTLALTDSTGIGIGVGVTDLDDDCDLEVVGLLGQSSDLGLVGGKEPWSSWRRREDLSVALVPQLHSQLQLELSSLLSCSSCNREREVCMVDEKERERMGNLKFSSLCCKPISGLTPLFSSLSSSVQISGAPLHQTKKYLQKWERLHTVSENERRLLCRWERQSFRCVYSRYSTVFVEWRSQ